MPAPDKLGHYLVGSLIALSGMLATFFAMLFWGASWHPDMPALVAMGATIIAAAGKEARDATGRGNVEFADFVWTVAGAGPVVITWLVVVT